MNSGWPEELLFTANVKASDRGLLCRLGWISERPELPALNGIGQREGIPAQQIDVVEYQRRETRKILGFYWELARKWHEGNGTGDDRCARRHPILTRLPI